MTIEQLQKTLNATIERMARQSMNYEGEIANLTAQVIMLQDALAAHEADHVPVEAAAPAAKTSSSKA